MNELFISEPNFDDLQNRAVIIFEDQRKIEIDYLPLVTKNDALKSVLTPTGWKKLTLKEKEQLLGEPFCNTLGRTVGYFFIGPRTPEAPEQGTVPFLGFKN